VESEEYGGERFEGEGEGRKRKGGGRRWRKCLSCQGQGGG